MSWPGTSIRVGHDEGVLITAYGNVNNLPELAECCVHSSPHTLSDPEQRKIFGGVIHSELKKAEAALRLQGKLITGSARQFWRDGGR